MPLCGVLQFTMRLCIWLEEISFFFVFLFFCFVAYDLQQLAEMDTALEV